MRFVVFCLTAGSLFLNEVESATAALRIWDGGGTNNNWTTATNWVGDAVPSPMDDLWFPLGVARPNPVDDFPSGTLINSLIISGTNYVLDGNVIALNAGITATNGISNMINNSLALAASQTFTISVGDDNLYLLGGINNQGHDLTFAISSPSRAQVVGVMSGAGGLTNNGTGSVLMYGNNTFSGPVAINSGSIVIYHGNALGSTSAGTTVAPAGLLVLANSITIAEPLELSGTLSALSGSKTWTGPITLNGAAPTIGANVGGTLTVNAIISGTNGFTKTLPGLLILNSNNTYSGTTTIDDGSLIVNGFQPNSPIVLNGVLLGGQGTVGNVTVGGSSQKIINPGINLGAGILTCSNITMSPSTSFQVNLNGTAPGTGYDQLNVHGSVALSNASFFPALNFDPPFGTSFVIINNDGVDPISGTFQGFPNGSILNLSGILLRLNYDGGDGNDVTLTRIFRPRFDRISFTNGQALLRATGAAPTLNYSIDAAASLPVWSNIGQVTADANGIIVFTDTNAAGFARRFYRAVGP